jgi:hypothetical protein
MYCFVKRERIQAAKDLLEAKRTLEENQRKRSVLYATRTIFNSNVLMGKILFNAA